MAKLNSQTARPFEIVSSNETELKYVEHLFVPIKGHTSLDEKWVQDRLAENPSILGLGDLVLFDRERRQPKAGRLDLLLEDIESHQRFTVEVQLGATDESHIIRTLEYWDIERKRYPQYDHVAVIVAEEITGRFLNVISLFNGQVPIIAIQMKVVQIENVISLIFTRVLDPIERGLDEERNAAESAEVNRDYWEKRSSPDMLGHLDKLLQAINSFAPGNELKYNKYYIGLSHNGKSNNFVAFKPQKKAIRLEIGMELSTKQVRSLEDLGIEVFAYIPRWKLHPMRLLPKDLQESKNMILELIKNSFEHYFS
jgi:hypothetical protein